MFTGAGFRPSRLGEGGGDGVGVGETTGDGDGSGVGLALALGTAAASGTELLDLTATSAKATTTTTAIAAAISKNFFADLLLNETERRENDGLFAGAGESISVGGKLAAAITEGLTTVTSDASLLAARLSRSFEIFMTRRPEGDSVPTLRSASMFGELVMAACSSPSRSAVASNS